MAKLVAPDKQVEDVITRLVREVALMEARNAELQEALYYTRTALCQQAKRWRNMRQRGDTHAKTYQ